MLCVYIVIGRSALVNSSDGRKRCQFWIVLGIAGCLLIIYSAKAYVHTMIDGTV